MEGRGGGREGNGGGPTSKGGKEKERGGKGMEREERGGEGADGRAPLSEILNTPLKVGLFNDVKKGQREGTGGKTREMKGERKHNA